MRSTPDTSEENDHGNHPDAYGLCHIVALKLPQAEWKKLQAIAAIEGIKPGPYSTRVVIDHLRQVDLAAPSRAPKR